MASYSPLLSSSRFTSLIPISLKSSIPSRRQYPVVLNEEENNASSLLGFSGQQLVFLKKKKKNNNLSFFSKELACVSGGGGRADSSEEELACVSGGGGRADSSSSLCVILGRVWRSYVVSNREEYHEKLRSIHLDDNVSSEFYDDKPILMTDGERMYCICMIRLVNHVKSWILMVKDSLVELLRVLVLPHIIYLLILNSIKKYLFGVTRIIYLTLNSIMKALFGIEDGVGNLLDILKNILFKWGTKSKWGKRLWPKPPKLKIGKKPRPKVQEKVTGEFFEEVVDDDEEVVAESGEKDVFEEEDNDDEAAAA